MISKKIPNPNKKSTKATRIRKLSDYETKPELEDSTERCLYWEGRNFIFTDYPAMVEEMIALASEAVKSKDPIDHWMLSWREDEKPDLDQVKEAIEIFLTHLGAADLQVIWALHDDTDKRHAHLEINRVDPITHKVRKFNKGFDREAAMQAIALIEAKQGWKPAENARYTVVNGKPVLQGDKLTSVKPSTTTRAIEALTGEKQPETIVQEVAGPIIREAKSWMELHQALAKENMRYERFGSGAMVYVGEVGIKASKADRNGSIAKLVQRLGPFEPAQEISENEYTDTNAQFAELKANQQSAVAHGDFSRHRMRAMQERVLADSRNGKKSTRPRLLRLAANADSGGPGGLRWPSDEGVRIDGMVGSGGSGNSRRIRRSTGRTPEPAQSAGPTWKQYSVALDKHRRGKARATEALEARHQSEWAELLNVQKKERDAAYELPRNGTGDLYKLLVAQVAREQAPIRNALTERHRMERHKLRELYPAMPIFKVWQTQPCITADALLPPDQQKAIYRSILTTCDKRLSDDIRALKANRNERRHVIYTNLGMVLFKDEGQTVTVLEPDSTEVCAMALALALAKFGPNLTVNGSDEFKWRVARASVEYGLTSHFRDPSLETMRATMQQRHDEEILAREYNDLVDQIDTNEVESSAIESDDIPG